MAINHNDGDGKSKKRKAAGKKSAGTNWAQKKSAGNATTPLKPTDGLNGAPAHDVTQGQARTKASAAKKAPAKRAAGRIQGKRKRGNAASSAGSTAEAAELDPMEAAKRTMKGSVPAIVNAMVKKAKEGSCTHAKTLLEMTGAKYMFTEGPEMREAGEPWAKLVLERMKQAEQESLRKEPLEAAKP